MRYFIALMAIIYLAGAGCKKDADKEETVTLDSIHKCHQSANPDSAEIATQLTGTWQLTHKMCTLNSSYIYPDKTIKAVFTSSGSLTVYENASIINEGSWKLAGSNNSGWWLDTNDPGEYLHGNLFICNNNLVFFSIHMEFGCDYFFKKNQ